MVFRFDVLVNFSTEVIFILLNFERIYELIFLSVTFSQLIQICFHFAPRRSMSSIQSGTACAGYLDTEIVRF